MLLDGIVTAVIPACIKKKQQPKLVNFYVAILILKTEENMLYYFKKDKKATETRFLQCMEKVLWLNVIRSGLQSFMLEICWTMLHCQVD